MKPTGLPSPLHPPVPPSRALPRRRRQGGTRNSYRALPAPGSARKVRRAAESASMQILPPPSNDLKLERVNHGISILPYPVTIILLLLFAPLLLVPVLLLI